MASAAQKRIKSISYAKYGYLFILPFFLVYAIFQLWPLINTFILSFYGNGNRVIGKDIMTGQDLINETHNDAFVGLDNFKALLFGGKDEFDAATVQHEQFFKAFGNTLILWIATLFHRLSCLYLLLFGLQMLNSRSWVKASLRLLCICLIL